MNNSPIDVDNMSSVAISKINNIQRKRRNGLLDKNQIVNVIDNFLNEEKY